MFSCVTVPLDLQVDEAGASLSLFFEIVRTAFLRTALSNAPQNASIKGSNLVLSFKLLFSLFPAIDKKILPRGWNFGIQKENQSTERILDYLR